MISDRSKSDYGVGASFKESYSKNKALSVMF